ncbi:MAG TPA: IS1182 family transposase [Chthonomonadaceae bacterium]|nr:IS1182 family transposase [Chthonomonadaceae bacterium]
MLGKRQAQRDLFDVGNVFPVALDPHSFHGQLAAAAERLFRDEDFAACYAERLGRASTPPSLLALMTLMQHECGCSDAEAVARTTFDLRWAAVLRRAAGAPLCVKSTFQLFRAHLILHDGVRKVFEQSIAEARRAGLLKRGALTVALDTKPILGRGAVEDTYNLLATGIQQLVRALAAGAKQEPEAWAAGHDLGRYFGPSVKGSADRDWSDPEARQQFLTEIVTDARRLLRLAGTALSGENAAPVREGAALLEQLLLQDVVETAGADGGTLQAAIKQGTAPERVPSATDPEQRHGRKSASKRFTGHKASVAVDVESQLILEAEVLPGSAGDASEALAQVERVEAATGQPVALTQGDCAYGGGETRQAFADAGRELVAKVPQESENGGLFPKRAFVIDLEQNTVTCPGGQTSARFTAEKDGGKTFHFGAACRECPLRAYCTTAAGGRTVAVHAQEARLRAARAAQASPEGRAQLRARVVVEHRLARLGQLGVGQARYRGREKSGFQLLLLATIANLRWTWNWKERQRAAAAAAGASDPGAPTAGGTAAEIQPGRTAGGATAGTPSGAAAARSGRSAPAPAGWRWLLLGHPLTPALACGASNAVFRPRF